MSSGRDDNYIEYLAATVEAAVTEATQLRAGRMSKPIKKPLHAIQDGSPYYKAKQDLNTTVTAWIKTLRTFSGMVYASAHVKGITDFKKSIDDAILVWKHSNRLEEKANIPAKTLYERDPQQHTQIKFLHDAQWLANLCLIQAQIAANLIVNPENHLPRLIQEYKSEMKAEIIHNESKSLKERMKFWKSKPNEAEMDSIVENRYNNPPPYMRASQIACLNLLKQLAAKHLQKHDEKTERKEEKIDAPRKSSKPS